MSSGSLLEPMVSEGDMTVRKDSYSAHTDIHVLCNTDEDKNSNRHSEADKERER